MFDAGNSIKSRAGRLLRAALPVKPPPPDFQPLKSAGGPR